MARKEKTGADDDSRRDDAPVPQEDAANAPAQSPAQAVPQARCGKACDCRRSKLHSFDWLGDIPGGFADSEYVEVQFKNTRKGYYRNSTNLPLGTGDMVAVEATPGHDIGMVTLTGALAELRMRRSLGRNGNVADIKRVFRLAKPNDLEKYEEAKAREDDTMIRARQIADGLKLNMKIGDVEYQGDGNKAIFYYIADERVDFRQLIKVLAETFKVRIEMKQIGARQEAGRIGGIGPCGRPLCCSSWMTNFVSVATSAARYQDISLNPQKLAGQCAKLKCCLNFEVDTYVESVKRMPSREIALETLDSTYYHFKTDIFKREITYSTDKSMPANLVTISADRAFEVITMNKRGEKPEKLALEDNEKPKAPKEFVELVGQDSVTRFDKAKKKKRKNNNSNNNNQQPNQPKERSRQEGSEPKQGQQQQRQPRPPKPNGNPGKEGGNNRQPRPDNNGQRQQPKRDNKRNDNRQPQRDGNNRRDNGNKPSTQPSNDTPA